MRNEQEHEFTPVDRTTAEALEQNKYTCKLVFKEGQVFKVQGRTMRVKRLYRRSIVLTPVGW